MDVIGYKPTDEVERHSLVFYPFCKRSSYDLS